MADSGTKFGFVSLLGRPNVGKSTLLNRLVGEPVSIVTHKAQTTRNRITGILTRKEGQVAFVDTPGLHMRETHALNRALNQTARDALGGVDLVLVLVDSLKMNDEDRQVLDLTARGGTPAFLVFNKIDRLDDRSRLLALTEELTREADYAGVFYVCATSGDGVEDLIQAVFKVLPEGVPQYDPDQFTDRPVRFLVAELIRQQLMLQLHQELPYGLTVEIEKFAEEARRTVIHGVIRVASDRHKGMVIGKQGAVLKRVGTRARHAAKELLGRPVHLELWVKVDPDWMDREDRLKQLGFT